MSNPPPAAPNPCCVPSKQRLQQLEFSRTASGGRSRATGGSTEGMVRLDGGPFLMGTESPEAFPADGEGPVRKITVDGFWMDARPVSNEQFREFVRVTGYETEAHRFGWSFVFHTHIAPELAEGTPLGVEWWCKVSGASWEHPEGPGSGIEERLHFFFSRCLGIFE